MFLQYPVYDGNFQMHIGYIYFDFHCESNEDHWSATLRWITLLQCTIFIFIKLVIPMHHRYRYLRLQRHEVLHRSKKDSQTRHRIAEEHVQINLSPWDRITPIQSSHRRLEQLIPQAFSRPFSEQKPVFPNFTLLSPRIVGISFPLSIWVVN